MSGTTMLARTMMGELWGKYTRRKREAKKDMQEGRVDHGHCLPLPKLKPP